jgi:MFS family permease
MVGPALPTIVHDLGSQSFIWVGSAYALVATASIPLSGGFAHVCHYLIRCRYGVLMDRQSLGRKQTLLTALFVLAAGSLVCALAKSMNVLIAGRGL